MAAVASAVAELECEVRMARRGRSMWVQLVTAIAWLEAGVEGITRMVAPME